MNKSSNNFYKIDKNEELINILLNSTQKLHEKAGLDYPRIRHMIKDEKGIKDIAVGMQGVSNTSDLPEDIFIDVVKSTINIDLKFDEILQKAVNEIMTSNKKGHSEKELYENNKSILKTYFYQYYYYLSFLYFYFQFVVNYYSVHYHFLY